MSGIAKATMTSQPRTLVLLARSSLGLVFNPVAEQVATLSVRPARTRTKSQRQQIAAPQPS